MARPVFSTPIPRIIETVRALAAWYQAYDAVAKAAHGPTWNGQAESLRIALDLEAADTQFAQETREDVEATRLRNEAVGAAQRFVRSVLASVQLAFEGDPALNAVMRDFAPEAPSRIRSPASARRAVNRAMKATLNHRSRLDAAMKRSERHLEVGQTVLDDLNTVGELEAREVLETRQAARARDEALAAALRFITRTQLAAEAMEYEQPEALADLFELYETTNPEAARRSTSDDLLGDDGVLEAVPTVGLDGEDGPV